MILETPEVTFGGFTATAQTVIHQWAMFSLVQRSVLSPSGEHFERSFVHTPGAVAVVAIDEDRNVILVRQYRASLHQEILELPAGMRDIPDEDPMETARREMAEETGFAVEKLTYLGTCLSSPGVTDSSVMVYLATGLTAGTASPHGPEELSMSVVRLPMAEILAMIDDGRLQDSKTVFGILLAVRLHSELIR